MARKIVNRSNVFHFHASIIVVVGRTVWHGKKIKFILKSFKWNRKSNKKFTFLAWHTNFVTCIYHKYNNFELEIRHSSKKMWAKWNWNYLFIFFVSFLPFLTFVVVVAASLLCDCCSLLLLFIWFVSFFYTTVVVVVIVHRSPCENWGEIKFEMP